MRCFGYGGGIVSPMPPPLPEGSSLSEFKIRRYLFTDNLTDDCQCILTIVFLCLRLPGCSCIGVNLSKVLITQLNDCQASLLKLVKHFGIRFFVVRERNLLIVSRFFSNNLLDILR